MRDTVLERKTRPAEPSSAPTMTAQHLGQEHAGHAKTMATDIRIPLGDFALERGGVLENDIITARIYGPKGAPLIVIPGGISASRFVADGEDGRSGSGGWWSDIVRPKGAVDLSRFQVLGVDLAPGLDNCSVRHSITTTDQAKRLARLLDVLDAQKVLGLIGMSYGGMVAMQFAALYPQRVEKLLVFGATHRPWPFAVGLRGIGRRIIEDMTKLGDPLGGLKLARELAMTTYRSPEEFKQRFTATPDSRTPPSFDVGQYLEARGRAYQDIMPVNRFLALSESIDLHTVNASLITCPTTLIGVENDQLAPPSEMRAFADAISGHVQLHIIKSIYGHDSFLKSVDILSPLIADFCRGERRAA